VNLVVVATAEGIPSMLLEDDGLTPGMREYCAGLLASARAIESVEALQVVDVWQRALVGSMSN
jgi:hypothetical protein